MAIHPKTQQRTVTSDKRLLSGWSQTNNAQESKGHFKGGAFILGKHRAPSYLLSAGDRQTRTGQGTVTAISSVDRSGMLCRLSDIYFSKEKVETINMITKKVLNAPKSLNLVRKLQSSSLP